MSTNPQAPQAPRSGAAAEGPIDVTPPPVSEGRQSPGPMHEITFAVSRQGSAILISAPKEIADGMDGDHLEDNCFKGIPKEPGTYIASVEFVFHQGYFEGYPAAGESDWEYIIHSFRPLAAPGAPQGGDGPSPSARLFRDLEAGEIIGPNDECWAYGCGPWMPAPDAIGQKYIPENGVPFRRLVSLEAPSSAPLSAAKGPDLPPQSSQEEGPAGVDLDGLPLGRLMSAITQARRDGNWSVVEAIGKEWRQARRLRAQAPASSPRDLEAVAAEIAKLRDAAGGGVVGTAKAMAYDKCLWLLSAIPPKGETPSEAARLMEIGNLLDAVRGLVTDEVRAKWPKSMQRADAFAEALRNGRWPTAEGVNAPGTPIEKAAREALRQAIEAKQAESSDRSYKEPRPEQVSFRQGQVDAYEQVLAMLATVGAPKDHKTTAETTFEAWWENLCVRPRRSVPLFLAKEWARYAWDARGGQP